jgi:hypothetical protein
LIKGIDYVGEYRPLRGEEDSAAPAVDDAEQQKAPPDRSSEALWIL